MQRPLMFAIASALVLGFAVAPASAARFERTAERVSYADLNLENRAGAEAMIGRIQRAAENVCGDRRGAMPLAFRVRLDRCVEDETRDALADLGHSGVSALYYGRHPEIIVASR
jgi:UrcA family protein